VGDTTNLAARLQQLADPGTVCVSETTQRAARSHFEFRRVGERTVKGRAEPVTVYTLLGPRAPGAAEPAGDGGSVGAMFVGHEEERAALTGCVARVLAGRGGVVSVAGEAGLGKSRLLAEVRRETIGRDVRWLEGRALSFSRTMSYLPILEIVKGCAAIAEDDGEEASWQKLERLVAGLFPGEVAEVLPYLATLLVLDVKEDYANRVRYLDARAMGHQIFRASRRLFERLALERPLVLVLEDWHWADQSSAELLEHLLPLVETSALLICCVGRPDLGTPMVRLLEVAARRYADRHTAITLAPLDAAASARLAQHLLATDERSARLHELVLRKAEGNPFFMEEVVRALIGMKAVVREEATDRWRAVAPIGEIALPDTIHGVIMARIDRLDEDLKQVVKLAAVVGRIFFYRVLSAIAEGERDLDRRLADLERVDLIRERRRVPELEYTFKHALVQEAAYESILGDRRQYLHRRTAECIESLFPDRLDEFASLLAYHYVRAADWRKAQEYLFKAGDQAARVAADTEALAHYERAADAYLRVFGDRWEPLERAVFERKMGEALFRRGEHQRATEYLRRALGYLGTSYPAGRWEIRLQILWELARHVGHRVVARVRAGRPPRPAGAAAEERVRIFLDLSWILYFVDQELLLLNTLTCLNVSERAGVALGIASGAMPLGFLCDIVGLHALAARYHRRAVASAEEIGHPGAIGLAYLGLGLHEHYVGRWDKALAHYARSAAAHRDAGDLRGWGGATLSIVQVCVDTGDLPRAIGEALQMVEVSRDGADQQVEAWGLVCLGLSRSRAGGLDEAVPALERAAEMFRAVPDYPMLAWTCACLGQTYLRQDRLREALAVLEESDRIIIRRNVRANQVAFCRNALAEAYLLVAEGLEGAERADAIRRAQQACRAALQQGRIFSGGLPGAQRLMGRSEWLRGRQSPAHAWWRRSVETAERLGARYDLGLTCLDIGKRTGDERSLERAAAVFAEIGATRDLADARSMPRASGA
jgi:tetratricopeptide (TPR) repeat protein